MKILVVDDDIVSRVVASDVLSEKDYEVLEASSAKEAIEYLELPENDSC